MKNYLYLLILLLGLQTTVKAQSIPTMGEVYNFRPGDVFMYYYTDYSNSPGNLIQGIGYSTDSLLSRNDGLDANGLPATTTYTFQRIYNDTVLQGQHGISFTTYHALTDTYQIKVTNLYDPVFTACNLTDTLCHDSAYVYQQAIGDSLPVTIYGYKNRIYDYTNPYNSPDIPHSNQQYAAGLGVVYYYHNLNPLQASACNCGSSNSRTLLQYRHTEPEPIGGLTINIYPNPTGNTVTAISDLLKNTGAELLLYNISGTQQRIEYTIAGNEAHINLQDIPKGVYVIRIKAGAEKASYRLIKL